MLQRTDETVTLCHGHSSREAQVDLEQTWKSMELEFCYTHATFIYHSTKLLDFKNILKTGDIWMNNEWQQQFSYICKNKNLESR